MVAERKIVHKNWLWQRAGALETKLLRKYKQSLARISISQEFNKCVMVSHYGEDTMEIDYTMYREICKDIESRYARTADVVEVVRCKDCVFYKPRTQSKHWHSVTKCCCRSACLTVNDFDFCSYGKRKEKNDFKE